MGTKFPSVSHYYKVVCCWLLELLLLLSWSRAHRVPLFFTISQSLLKLMSIESLMPSNHLILCCPFLLLLSIFPSIRVFSNRLVLCISWQSITSIQILFQKNIFKCLVISAIKFLGLGLVSGTLWEPGVIWAHICHPGLDSCIALVLLGKSVIYLIFSTDLLSSI